MRTFEPENVIFPMYLVAALVASALRRSLLQVLLISQCVYRVLWYIPAGSVLYGHQKCEEGIIRICPVQHSFHMVFTGIFVGFT